MPDEKRAEPVHSNKAVAMQKQKRKTISVKSQKAIDSGNVQAVIDSLSPKQLRFCEEYLTDMNGTQAAIRAQYKPNNAKQIAFQLMENPAVRIAIDALRSQRNQNSDITKDFVLKGIVRTVQAAQDDNNHNATLRGYELLAKHLGMFIDKTEISGPGGGAIEMAQKKVEEDVREFTSKLSSLAKRAGPSEVTKLPDASAKSGT